ncbi:MAG: hypothetical protein M3R63_12465 [Actinomycetota bacterium]|nr:hypothetical protein [Actinomycetota bacterium]
MTTPGLQDPTISYLVHRGVLIGIVITIALGFGYLVFQWTPGIQESVISAIQAVRDEWTSWGWELF